MNKDIFQKILKGIGILVIIIIFAWYFPLPVDNWFKVKIGEASNFLGLFLAVLGLYFAVSLFLGNQIIKLFPKFFKDQYVELKFEEFTKRVIEFQKDKETKLDKKNKEELENEIKRILTDKYEVLFEFLKTFIKNNEYESKLKKHYLDYILGYNYLDANTKTDYKTALKNKINDK